MRMFVSLRMWFGLFAVLAVALLLIEMPVGAHKDESGKGTIVGQVTDPQGFPIEGMAVSVKEGSTTTTDPGGMYTLTGVKQEERVVVNFRKDGYAPGFGIATLEIEREKECDKHKHKKDKDHKKCEEEIKLDKVTLNKVMIPAGAAQTVDAAAGGTVEQNGFKVIFPAGSIATTGTVDIVISPIDVSTNEILAFPGDFTGTAANGQNVLLETFSLMDVSLSQGGVPVNLKPGATASLEFLLPANTSLTAGQTIPLWFFDEKKGKWKEEGIGTVGTSTSDPTRLAVFGQVNHFTWWNVDQPISTQTCLTGYVYNENGNPVTGVYVYANGVDYSGVSYGVTDTTGRYCVNVKRSSVVTLKAQFNADGVTVSTTSGPISTPAAQMTCATGGCAQVPNIILNTIVSCIQGDVRDAAGNPVVGVTVSSTTGGYATTDANGAFCIGVPANTAVTVFTPGYAAVTVTTPPTGGSCALGGCALAEIRPPTTTGPACLRVTVTGNEIPIPNANIYVYEAGTTNLLAQGQTDVSGNLCIDGLPGNIDMDVQAFAPDCFVEFTVNPGAGTTCSDGNCVFLPLECWPIVE